MHDIVIRGGHRRRRHRRRAVRGRRGHRRRGHHRGRRRWPRPAVARSTPPACWSCPGWVDVHTHYDGQATWDAELAPSSWHGVTTAIFGNCAVGFAPVAPGGEAFLINLMEGVEDIPGSVLAEGIDFTWESFPEYLDALDAMPRAIDVGAQVPHAALRVYVMGERGGDHTERATPDEIAEMGRLAVEGIRGRRVRVHHLAHHQPPRRRRPLHAEPDRRGRRADRHRRGHGRGRRRRAAGHQRLREPRGDGAAADAGRGVGPPAVVLADPGRPAAGLLAPRARPGRRGQRRRAAACGPRSAPGPSACCSACRARSIRCASSPATPSCADLPIDERVAELRRPEVRERILGRRARSRLQRLPRQGACSRTFELSDPPDYEPAPEQAIARRAEALGVSTWELMYDLLLADDGHAMLYHPFQNYSTGDLGPGPGDAPRPQHHPGPERRRGPRRHDLRRQLPHLPAHPLGARPRAGSRASGWPRPSTARPRPPPRPSASTTGAWWRPATGPTSTWSTSMR